MTTEKKRKAEREKKPEFAGNTEDARTDLTELAGLLRGLLSSRSQHFSAQRRHLMTRSAEAIERYLKGEATSLNSAFGLTKRGPPGKPEEHEAIARRIDDLLAPQLETVGMSASEIIENANREGVKICMVRGKLEPRGDRARADLWEPVIRRRKADIVAFLNREATSNPTPLPAGGVKKERQRLSWKPVVEALNKEGCSVTDENTLRRIYWKYWPKLRAEAALHEWPPEEN